MELSSEGSAAGAIGSKGSTSSSTLTAITTLAACTAFPLRKLGGVMYEERLPFLPAFLRCGLPAGWACASSSCESQLLLSGSPGREESADI